MSVLRGLGRSCDRAGVSLVIASGFNEPMDAVAGIRARPEHVPPGVRAIAIDAPDGDPDGVRVDYAPAATALAEHLAGVGHRRAVIVSWAGAGPRLRALVEAWQRVGDARVLMAAGATYGHGDLAARAIQAAEPEATAVIALCDPLARGIVDAMRWSGRRVPHDISVASIDGLDGTDLAGLTAVLVPYEPLGELAGSLVLGADGVPPALPATLAIRQTTGPVAR